MAEKLKIIPLGGLNEIGKNLTVYEYGNDIIIVDVGMGFPDDDMYGVDVVIPDVSYLIKHKDKIRGIFLTHGHEDHIGALPYVLRSFNAPIYATRMTLGLVRLKLEEHKLLDTTKLVTCEAGDIIQAGKFSVEFIHANHSIADAVSFAVKCPVGVVVHTGDFKIDPTPIKGKIMDLTRLGQLGKEGVLAMLADSTNVERPGHTRSERAVGASFDELFKGCKERIIVTTFASNAHRLQAILTVAHKCGRKVAVLGDMGELGDLTDQAHYNMGALAAMLGIDEVVAIGAKAEKIADGAAQSGGSVTHFATKEEAVHELTDQLGTDTAMLVKASHAMHFGWIVEQLKQAYD